MTDTERRQRLETWLNVIKTDVQDLLLDDYIFWEVQTFIAGNPRFASSSGLVTQWMASSFVQAIAVGVRRQSKAGADDVSLKRFLQEVRDFPTLVSRDRYMRLFEGSQDWLRETGERHFDRLAGAGNSHLPTPLISQQLAALESAVRGIEHYVDRRVAHYDQRGLARPTPTFADLKAALRALEQLVIFYWVLITGGSMTTLLPTIQYDWTDVLAFPWVPREGDE
jgi:hypothetical protein